MIARRLVVHGRVQGVFYRDWTVENACGLGLVGWVTNCSDGTVAAHLEGEESAVLKLIERMRRGPAAAEVDRLEQADVPREGLSDFERR